jgi:hypothetical protein
MQYRPALAGIPDQKGWRIKNAGYGPLSRFARVRIDREKIRRHLARHPAGRGVDLHRRGPRL